MRRYFVNKEINIYWNARLHWLMFTIKQKDLNRADRGSAAQPHGAESLVYQGFFLA